MSQVDEHARASSIFGRHKNRVPGRAAASNKQQDEPYIEQGSGEDRAKMAGPYIAMAKAGDFTKAAKLVQEAVYQLSPGEFDSLPEDWQMVLLDNARVVSLLLAAPPPPAITCAMLKDFTRPTLVMRGEKTLEWYALISEAIINCVPGGSEGHSSKCQPRWARP